MDEKPIPEQPPPLSTTGDTGGDPDEGQVIGPDGEAPEDPAARSFYQGCLIMLLFIGIMLGIFSLLYRFFLAT